MNGGPVAGNDPTVAAIVEQFRRDPEAAARVFLELAQPISRQVFLEFKLSGRDAEDAVSDGYVRLSAKDFSALVRVKDPTIAYGVWLVGLFRNLARERVRAEIRERERRLVERRAAAVVASVNRRMAERIARARAMPRGGWRSLTIRQREALLLHFEGLTTQIVATRIGIGFEAARERLWRAWAVLARGSQAKRGKTPPLLALVPRRPTRVLSALDRQAYALSEAGASRAQIAEALSCTKVAVRSRGQRVRRFLAQEMASRSDRDTPPPAIVTS